MSSSSSAPVESMIRGSSGRPGRRTALEPAAMMQRSKETVVAPSAPSTRRTFGEVNVPRAAHDLDLALLGEAVEALR